MPDPNAGGITSRAVRPPALATTTTDPLAMPSADNFNLEKGLKIKIVCGAKKILKHFLLLGSICL
jgi:hypothetical protein